MKTTLLCLALYLASLDNAVADGLADICIPRDQVTSHVEAPIIEGGPAGQAILALADGVITFSDVLGGTDVVAVDYVGHCLVFYRGTMRQRLPSAEPVKKNQPMGIWGGKHEQG